MGAVEVHKEAPRSKVGEGVSKLTRSDIIATNVVVYPPTSFQVSADLFET